MASWLGTGVVVVGHKQRWWGEESSVEIFAENQINFLNLKCVILNELSSMDPSYATCRQSETMIRSAMIGMQQLLPK